MDINSWADMLSAVAQLRKNEVKEQFTNIVIDTIDELVAMLGDHILKTNGASKPAEMAFGSYYVMLDTELRKMFRNITQLGYGLVIIGHTKEKKYDESSQFNGKKFLEPALDVRSKKIIDGLVDLQVIVAREYDSSGKPHSVMNFEPSAFSATKTRFPYIVPSAPLGYSHLLKAVNDAIDKQAAETGTTPTNEAPQAVVEAPADLEALKAEASTLAQSLISAGKGNFVVAEMQSTLGCKISEADPTKITELQALIETFKNQ